jgi:hypothetical protein
LEIIRCPSRLGAADDATANDNKVAQSCAAEYPLTPQHSPAPARRREQLARPNGDGVRGEYITGISL